MKIHYSQSWEDAELLLHALALQSGDTVFSITSGGCNSLALASQPIDSVFTIDINPAQNALLDLKHKAILAFEHDTLLEFLGVSKSGIREKLFGRLSGNLSGEALEFWRNHRHYIRKGIIHCGKFERYLNIFRKYILPLVHSRTTTGELLTLKTEPEQLEYYNTRWDTFRWRLVFRLFFSHTVMKWMGRSPEMFQYAVKDRISDHYLGKTRKAFTSSVIFNNSYLDYILCGNFVHSLPLYLRSVVTDRIRANRVPIDIRTGHILDILKGLPDNSFSKFNLSDVFESLSEKETQLIFSEILRTAKQGGRIIFWNNLVRRNINNELISYFHREESLEKQLRLKEKVFFYDDLNIYTIVK